MSARGTEEDFFMLEIGRGIEGTGIKPGVIEVATDPEGVTPFIEKASAGRGQSEQSHGHSRHNAYPYCQP